jgi:hypothetical protein
LIDTKELVQIRAWREQASPALEVLTNFIIVRYCTENWIRYWLKLMLNSPGRTCNLRNRVSCVISRDSSQIFRRNPVSSPMRHSCYSPIARSGIRAPEIASVGVRDARFSAMDLVLCHTTADFDSLGAAVGLCVLHRGSRIVLTGGCHPTVRDFLALHRDEYPLIERRSVNPQQIRSISIVDASQRDRLGKAAEWLDLPHINEIAVFDHHLQADLDIPATVTQIEAVGATTTLIVEKLREKFKNAAENSASTSIQVPSPLRAQRREMQWLWRG